MVARAFLSSSHAALTSTFTLWRRSLALIFQAAPRLTLAMALLMLLQAFLPVATLWASRGVVNAAARQLGLATGAAAGQDLSLAGWVTLAAIFIVAGQLAAPAFQAAQHAASDRLTAFTNGEIIKAANRWRGLARFEDPTMADRLATARSYAASGLAGLVTDAGALVQNLFMTVAMGAALWRLHPLAPILVILAHAPHALQENAFGQAMANLHEAESAEGRRMELYREAALGAAQAKDVRLFGLGGFFSDRHAAVFRRMGADVWAIRQRLLRTMLPARVLAAVIAAAVYLYAIRRVLDGALTLGDLVLFSGALLQLDAALTGAGFGVGYLTAFFTDLPSLFYTLDAGPDLAPPPHPQPLPGFAGEGSRTRGSRRTTSPSPLPWGGAGEGLPAPRPIRSGLVLERVGFRYPGSTTDVLGDISFSLRPGERLALVGRNGAGKTTLVKLLARLYDPSDGRILLDGADLRDYDLADLRRQVGVIFQDFVTYELTAQENIGLCDLDKVRDLPKVRTAAARGGAAELIESLPKGYATRLGNRFGGVALSAGQWQSIALSRASMRQAQLLILDEPTAALDVRAEYEVYRRFAELTRDATTVLVSHRFSTVRMADRIVYLEDGRLVEAGSHDELIAHGGGYAHLYRLQAELYR